MINKIIEQELFAVSKRMRIDILRMINQAGSGHPGPTFSIVEILSYLYFFKMRIDPKNPNMPDRDRFVLSKGHASPALYAALYEKGYFDEEEMLSLRKIGSKLQGHPSVKMDGVDATTGSLGIGLSQAVGMALGAKIQKSDVKIFALIGDGECDEGQIWEAALFASHQRLDNLYVFIDNNHDQYEGHVCDVLNLEPLDKKWDSFGWHTMVIDGHHFGDLDNFFTESEKNDHCPHIAIAQTHKGYGVSFMDNNPEYHARALNESEFIRAINELKSDS